MGIRNPDMSGFWMVDCVRISNGVWISNGVRIWMVPTIQNPEGGQTIRNPTSKMSGYWKILDLEWLDFGSPLYTPQPTLNLNIFMPSSTSWSVTDFETFLKVLGPAQSAKMSYIFIFNKLTLTTWVKLKNISVTFWFCIPFQMTKNLLFVLWRFLEGTDWVRGSTQNVSLPKDVFLRRESK